MSLVDASNVVCFCHQTKVVAFGVDFLKCEAVVQLIIVLYNSTQLLPHPPLSPFHLLRNLHLQLSFVLHNE